jgi:dUTP pyrophosphatase
MLGLGYGSCGESIEDALSIPIQLTLVNGDDSFVPVYAKSGDSGCDGKANINEPVQILSGDSAVIPLGIKVAIPSGFEIQVRPRSGLATKFKVTVLNSPGTVDNNFRGEIGAIIINHGNYPFVVKPGDRICQLVLNKVEQISWKIVEELPASVRGEDGFGSTGV